MHNLGVEGKRLFWCKRCGTLKEEGPDNFVSVEPPIFIDQLKNRVRVQGVVNAEFRVEDGDMPYPRITFLGIH